MAMWFYCKYCVGTGRHLHKLKAKSCVECSATGVVPERAWLAQDHTLDGAGDFIAGFGPAPLHVVQSRLNSVRKTTRLKACLIRFGLRLKLQLTPSAFFKRIKKHVRSPRP